MRYKIDPPEGYAPSNTARKNSKTSSIGTNGQGTTEGFSNSNSVSSTQLHPATAGAGNGKSQSAAGQHQSQETKQRLISSAPPIPSAATVITTTATAAITSTTNRHPKIYSREVNIPKLFREISHLDSELQVHLEYSTSRRMPMTEEQQQWLLLKENERQKKYKEYLLLHSTNSNSNSNSSTSVTGNKNKNNEKDKNRKNSKVIMPAIGSSGAGATGGGVMELGGGPVLEDPHEIMEKKFPIFDADEYPEAQGALRCQQLEECNRVYEALSKKFPNVDMNVIERALVTPQDRNTVRQFLPSLCFCLMIESDSDD